LKQNRTKVHTSNKTLTLVHKRKQKTVANTR